jgi:hypothetical protein
LIAKVFGGALLVTDNASDLGSGLPKDQSQQTFVPDYGDHHSQHPYHPGLTPQGRSQLFADPCFCQAAALMILCGTERF